MYGKKVKETLFNDITAEIFLNPEKLALKCKRHSEPQIHMKNLPAVH